MKFISLVIPNAIHDKLYRLHPVVYIFNYIKHIGHIPTPIAFTEDIPILLVMSMVVI